MRDFNSLAEFGAHLVTLQAAESLALHKGLDQVARLVEKTAKDEIGQYQPAIGPFPEWAPLAASTEAEKARMGFPLDAPLLRTGEMRDSIQHETNGFEAIVGSTDDKMVYHEFGTDKIPPRPVIGPAAFSNQEKIQEILGTAVVSGFIGGNVIPPSLGYDLDIK